MADAFNRAIPLTGQSLARWRHRKDQAELNSQYWMSVLQAGFLQRQIKGASDTDPVPSDVIGRVDAVRRNAGHNVAEMRRRADACNVWQRLLTLLLANSALERFILASATAALESDPLRSPGFPKSIDGLAFKKRKISMPEISTTPLVKGEWPGRTAAFKKLFGAAPDILTHESGELEKLRKMRNSVAHEFGSVELAASLPPSASLIIGARSDRVLSPGRQALSEARLLKWLVRQPPLASWPGHTLG